MYRRKLIRAAIAAGVTFLLIAAAFVGGVVFQHRSRGNEPKYEPPEPVVTASQLAIDVQNIAEYATLEYSYTNVGKFEDRVDFYGWSVPFTTKSFIITYDGSMKLGIQGEDIGVEVAGKEIRIRVPQAQILSHVIYEDTVELLDQSKNIFNQIQIEDYTGFASDRKQEMEQKAEEKGLFEEARSRAEKQIGDFMRALPDVQDGGYSIVFLKLLPVEEGSVPPAGEDPSASAAGDTASISTAPQEQQGD